MNEAIDRLIVWEMNYGNGAKFIGIEWSEWFWD